MSSKDLFGQFGHFGKNFAVWPERVFEVYLENHFITLAMRIMHMVSVMFSQFLSFLLSTGGGELRA